MNLLKAQIDKQLLFNRSKNLFHAEFEKEFAFLRLSPQMIEKVRSLNQVSEKELLEYLIGKVTKEFGSVNQYYSFDDLSLRSLRKIYSQLFLEIRQVQLNNGSELGEIEKSHYSRLRSWLFHTNGFAKEMYADQPAYLENVPCAEYSAELQLGILGINPQELMGPVLDVGCGPEGRLVEHLRSQGIEVYGIDRFIETGPFFQKYDWLEYEFKSRSWGTIISNLGFSNHFNHHHLRTDGNYLRYAKKYVEIINALKSGGSFYYAPGLSFIEEHLDVNKFKVEKRSILNSEYNSVRITQLLHY